MGGQWSSGHLLEERWAAAVPGITLQRAEMEQISSISFKRTSQERARNNLYCMRLAWSPSELLNQTSVTPLGSGEYLKKYNRTMNFAQQHVWLWRCLSQEPKVAAVQEEAKDKECKSSSMAQRQILRRPLSWGSAAVNARLSCPQRTPKTVLVQLYYHTGQNSKLPLLSNYVGLVKAETKWSILQLPRGIRHTSTTESRNDHFQMEKKP